VNTGRKTMNDALWGYLLRWDRWSQRRRIRRWLVVGWTAWLLWWLVIALGGLHVLRWDALGAFLLMLCAFTIAALGLNLTRRQIDEISLEDRAQMKHGVAFIELPESERVQLYRQLKRERMFGHRSVDERELTLERDSHARAYRLMRWWLPLLVLGWWGACIWAPQLFARAGLIVGAAVLSWLAMAVVSLPVLLRLWTDPDRSRELKSETKREATSC
jgi:hypothetical protein